MIDNITYWGYGFKYSISIYDNEISITNAISGCLIDKIEIEGVIINCVNKIYKKKGLWDCKNYKDHLNFIDRLLKIMHKQNYNILFKLLVSDLKEVRKLAKLHLTSQS